MESSVTVFLITIASLLMVGAIGELVFARTRIPDALWLIAVGVFLRVSGVVDASTLRSITPYFAAITLIIVLFDGGSRLVVGDLVRAAGRGTAMALATFFVTMGVVALFSLGLAALGLLEPWSLVHGLMLGAIVGGSSSLILMPSLSLSKAPARIANLINIESALTDALCVVFTLAFIDVLVSGSASVGDTVLTLLKGFGIASGLGALLGWAWIPVMRAMQGSTYAYPFTLAGLMLLYVIVDYAGGSPAMGVLAFAVVVGNAAPFVRWLHRLGPGDAEIALDARVQEIHSQISFIVKSLFFTFIGLMLSPPWSLLIMGAVMGLVLLLARLPAVFFAVRGAGLSEREVDIAYVCLPRGMAAGALATLPHLAGVAGTEEVPSLVFAAVVSSIVIFTVGFRRVYRPEGAAATKGPLGHVSSDMVKGTGDGENDHAGAAVASGGGAAVIRPVTAPLAAALAGPVTATEVDLGAAPTRRITPISTPAPATEVDLGAATTASSPADFAAAPTRRITPIATPVPAITPADFAAAPTRRITPIATPVPVSSEPAPIPMRVPPRGTTPPPPSEPAPIPMLVPPRRVTPIATPVPPSPSPAADAEIAPAPAPAVPSLAEIVARFVPPGGRDEDPAEPEPPAPAERGVGYDEP